MVFPSVPLYLDPPTSWNQQLLHQQQPGNNNTGGGGGSGGGGGGSSNDLLLLHHHHQHQHQHQQQQQQQQLQPAPTQQLIQAAQPRPDGPAGQGPPGQVRPNSMADRARMAKIPQPEQALKCPRCDSTNTKFCYFNNYSLTQPRHFCKTCRRYWTRGGALRNVPVGGGCRRNKRSKSSSSSKSSASAAQTGGASSSSSSVAATSASLPVPPSQMQFLAQLHHPMIDYAPTGPSIGLGFSGMQHQQQQQQQQGVEQVEYSQLGEQWRMNQIQQFPFLGGLEAPSHLQAPPIYSFDGAPSSAELITQLAGVKMEDNNSRGINLARQYNLGMNPRSSAAASDHFWAAGSGSSGGGADQSGSADAAAGGGVGGWMTNLSGFNSSSTGSLL